MSLLDHLDLILKNDYTLDWELVFLISILTVIYYILVDVFSFEKKILKILRDDK